MILVTLVGLLTAFVLGPGAGTAAGRPPQQATADATARAVRQDTVALPSAPMPDNGDIAGNGRWVAYVSNSRLYVYDMKADARSQVASRVTTYRPALSRTGRFVAYASRGRVWRWDRERGRAVKVGLGGDEVAMSASGRFIAFETTQGDQVNLKVVDLKSRRHTIVYSGTPRAREGDVALGSFDISSDGSAVSFWTDIVFGPRTCDLHVWRRGVPEVVFTGLANETGNCPSAMPFLAPGGQFVTYQDDDAPEPGEPGERSGWHRIDVTSGQNSKLTLPAPTGCQTQPDFNGMVSEDGSTIAYSTLDWAAGPRCPFTIQLWRIGAPDSREIHRVRGARAGSGIPNAVVYGIAAQGQAVLLAVQARPTKMAVWHR